MNEVAPPTPDPHPRVWVRAQQDRYRSSWSLRERLGLGLWRLVWLVAFLPTPRQLWRWRNFLLRLFGAKIEGHAFVASSCYIWIPWQFEMEDRACLARGSEVYNLGPVVLRERCVVTQYVYLCAGTHDLADLEVLPLMVGTIEIGREAFIGTRAIILPGVTVGEGAVVGAGSVVAKDVPAWTIAAGNPCRPIKPRAVKGRAPGPSSAAPGAS